MRTTRIAIVLALAAGLWASAPGAAVADHPECEEGADVCEFPTPAECAAGDHNGVWSGGPPGRGAVCVAVEGTIVLYTGGNANVPCGVIIVADQDVAGSRDDPTGADPNTCP